MKPERHPLWMAYSNVYTRTAPRKSMLITLESLAKAYRERAQDMDPDVRLARGETPAEVAARIASVRNSYRLIRDVLADQTKAWVMPPQSDAAPQGPVHFRSSSGPQMSVQTTSQRPAGWSSGPWNVKPVPGFGAKPSAQAARPSRVRHIATVRRDEGRQDELRDRIYRDLMAPPRPLLGRFLVQQGLVTLSELIRAVHWQRQQRPPVGRIAINWDLMAWNDVIELLKSKEAKTPFCTHAVRNGLLEPAQRVAILTRQREMQKPIGQYFIDHQILSRREIEEAADLAKRSV
ncbi:MAG: hypothetical protein AAGD10_11285 [Myxococcota bacterium]